MYILNYDEQPPGGSIVAIFSVALPAAGITFHRLKLIASKRGHLFISFPSYSTEDEQGKKIYHPFVEMTEERREDFQNKVLEALEPYTRERATAPHG